MASTPDPDRVHEPAPAERRRLPLSEGAPVADLARALRERVRGEVRFDAGSRALYATDASNYRQVPIGVVVPRDVDDVVATLAVCRALGAPVTSRGGGTSLAGQGCNVAVVVDFSKHVDRILSVDPARRLARVEPGVVLDELRRAADRHGLTFGPDPSTHDHCTLGGMIGNNSCGTHSMMAGCTDANVESLEIATYDGARFEVGKTSWDELDAIAREPSATSAARTATCRWRARRPASRPRCGERRTTPSSSRTASAAAGRSSSSPGAARCTPPRCCEWR
jgi:FAD/FMN-containing dehydrogenase